MNIAVPKSWWRLALMVNPIVFQKGMSVGEAAAEDDEEYLLDCFVDNGNYAAAIDISKPTSILLGRVGSGKSALIKHLAEHQNNVIVVSPENLALNFLANSNTLRFFEGVGVNLDPFYSLLWKHIFVVELLRKKFAIFNEDAQKSFLNRLTSIFDRDRSKQRAFKYLQHWGETFWNESEYRTKEFTTKLEGKLESELGFSVAAAKAGAKAGAGLTSEQKGEVLYHGQRVVNNIQLKELNEVIQLLSTQLFNDKLERWYIAVDKLDEDWVSEELRFKLIKSLIDTIRSFRAIQSVKIIVALRTDLYYSMTQKVTSYGFQEEKLSGYYIRMRWERSSLENLLEARLNKLFRRQYSGEPIRLRDVLPNTQMEQGRSSIEYILDRTSFRPREAISFLNRCISRANGKSNITPSMIREAEGDYSNERLNSTFEEWRREYPYLRALTDLLKRSTGEFSCNTISTANVERVAFALLASEMNFAPFHKDVVENAAADPDKFAIAFVAQAIQILYQVGVVGVKLEPTSPRVWSFDDTPTIDVGLIRPDTKCLIHRTFHRSLGVVLSGR